MNAYSRTGNISAKSLQQEKEEHQIDNPNLAGKISFALVSVRLVC